MKWRKDAAAMMVAAAAGAAGACATGAFVWRRATRRYLASLDAAATEAPVCEFSPEELAELPAPVRRYFTFALTPGQRFVQRARIVQEGVFRTGGPGSRWSPFTAVQHFTSKPPGFLWDARIQMAPCLKVRVRDSYIAGQGAMQASIASLLPVLNQRGRTELAAGALHRYLAEAVWLPTALLPGQGVVWEAIDDHEARASLTDNDMSVSLVFRFGDSGEVLSAYTPERYREVEGTAVQTPWICYYGRYTCFGGMMIPMKGEAVWVLPEQPLSYCKLHLRDVTLGEQRSTA